MPAVDITESSSTGWFTTDIQRMMYGFGDSKNPLKEAAELIEEIVREQQIQLLNLLLEVSAKLESKKIGTREFLFLLRHNPVKLRRFCTYLQASDLRKFSEANDAEKETNEFVEFHHESKKLQTALSFLIVIDPTGYLASVADPTKPSPLPDDLIKERHQRIESMTAAMDVQQYLEYAKAKSISFRRSQHSGKFQEWLFKDSPAIEPSMTAKAWSIMSYFAYETVAQIVDLAFIVRRDNSQAVDAVERNTVPRVSPANADLTKPTWSNSIKPLQVSEILEAIRRFNNTHHTTCAPFRRSGIANRRRLLAL